MGVRFLKVHKVLPKVTGKSYEQHRREEMEACLDVGNNEGDLFKQVLIKLQ